MGLNCHRGLVFATACLSMMLDVGFMLSFGTLYVDIMTTFNTSRSEAALVQSVMVAVRSVVGLISGAVVQKFGSAYSGMFGSFLAATGLVLSFFATSVLYLELTMGILFAFGTSCLYISSAVAVGQFYSGKARHLLISVQSAAGGVGGMIYPFLLKYLNDDFGFRGTLLISGGVYLHIVPFAFLWKANGKYGSHIKTVEEKNQPSNSKSYSDTILCLSNKFTTVKLCDEQSIKIETVVENKKSASETMNQDNEGDFNNRKSAERVSDAYKTGSSRSTRKWVTFDDNSTRISPQNGFGKPCGNFIENIQNSMDLNTPKDSISSYGDEESNIGECSEHEDYKELESRDKCLADNADVVIETLLTPPILESRSQRVQSGNQTNLKNVRTFEKSVLAPEDETLCHRLKYLLCNPSFALFAVGLGIAFSALGIIFIFIVDLFMDAGFSQTDAAFGMFLMHTFGVGGRLLPGIIMQWQRVATLSVPLIASIATAVAMAGLVYVTDLALAFIISAFIGIPYGMFVSMFSVTSLKLVGINRLSNALGILLTFNGVGSALAGPVSGLLRDSTGSYRFPFLIAAGMVLVSGILFSIALIVRRKHSKLQIDERTPLLKN